MSYEGTTEDQKAFDECLTVYRACREACDSGRLSAIDASAFKGNQWRPDRKPRAEDFVADFARAGESVLKQEGWHSRLILFRLHYLGGAGYRAALEFLGLGEMTWVAWTEEIRTAVGQELVRRKIHPPQRYFEEFTAKVVA